MLGGPPGGPLPGGSRPGAPRVSVGRQPESPRPRGGCAGRALGGPPAGRCPRRAARPGARSRHCGPRQAERKEGRDDRKLEASDDRFDGHVARQGGRCRKNESRRPNRVPSHPFAFDAEKEQTSESPLKVCHVQEYNHSDDITSADQSGAPNARLPDVPAMHACGPMFNQGSNFVGHQRRIRLASCMDSAAYVQRATRTSGQRWSGNPAPS